MAEDTDGRVERLQAVALAAEALLPLLRERWLIPRSARAPLTDALVNLLPGDLPEKHPLPVEDV